MPRYGPFSERTYRRLLGAARRLRWVGSVFLKLHPFLERDIALAGLDIDPVDYAAITVFVSLYNGAIAAAGLFVVFLVIGLPPHTIFPTTILVFLIAVAFYYFQFVSYPKVHYSARSRRIEEDLLFALRELLICLRSGMPLYQALVKVASGNYREASEEFKKIVAEVNAGKPLVQALEDSALRVKSKHYRSVIWAMISAIRGGTDVTAAIENAVKALSEEYKIRIREYGASLGTIMLFYMISTGVFPCLSLVLLMVAGPMMNLRFTRMQFIAIATVMIIFMHVTFLSTIKVKRPAVIQ